MKNLSRHAEWLSLIEISGPFLTVSMLDKAFPQGLEAVETPRRQKLRAAYDEWREAVDQQDELLSELHREWVRLVLTEMLEYDHESLVHADDWPDDLPSVSSQEHTGTFKPDWIVRSPARAKPRLFIAVLPPDTDLESVQRGDDWPVSLQERMTLLCRAHGVRVGLLTDGERWMLVNAPVGSTSSQASWYARLWSQEPITLKAFQSLLGVRRCFGPTEDTLESLLDESLKHHEEVTDTLGEQVRRAVEVLVQCLDKADEDRNRELLCDVKPVELYEAGLTVMMRLVFVLCAEERGLLLLGDSVYDRCYAVSTLRGQLAEEADRYGPEVLDRRHDAWARLLAIFRAVFGGIEHESLRMPALGGSLFDPDRFSFLEGRAKGTSWRDTSAAPLPIDNRTVLLLLNSLQILEQSGGALLLSYRALDVEQIGHVYEGLLEHTVARVPRVTLGLQGSQKAKNPNVALAELESARLDGEAALVKLVLDVTGRSESAIRNGLSKPADDTIFGRVLGVCGGDTELAERIRPFTNLLRTDAWDDPIVYRDNSFMVTLGADRRETGTHYTPKSLTESIVTTTLEPVVYIGPAEGKPREEWTLKSSREILDLKVCDPAMGSGAFLVQACRYLGEKLVEAWLHKEAAGKAITVDGEALDGLGAEEPLPTPLDERLTIARRLIAERCLYGVDVNPLAVELAKLSIWLVTLAKGRPFGFLDHNLRSGDSLLGIHRLEQLTRLRMDTESGQQYQLRIFGQNIEAAVKEAIELRKRLRTTTIRDIKDVEAMARLDREARRKLEPVELIADAFIGEIFTAKGPDILETRLAALGAEAEKVVHGDAHTIKGLIKHTVANLSAGVLDGRPRRPFHWSLEFPEAFIGRGGFDALVFNPPFIGGTKISGGHGGEYLRYLKKYFISRQNTDLCAYFVQRVLSICSTGGTFGFLATKTIAQADTREASLDLVATEGNIYFAMTSVPWPGVASVFVSVIAVSRTYNRVPRVLDGRIVDQINAFLSSEMLFVEKPFTLTTPVQSFKGVTVVGTEGFCVSDVQEQRYLLDDGRNKEVLKPFLGGADIMRNIDSMPNRTIIDFADLPLEEAQQYCAPFAHVIEHVRPIREKVNRKAHRERWWQYGDVRQGLRKAIAELDRVLVSGQTVKYLCFVWCPSTWVFDQKCVVVATNEDVHFAVLNCSCFDVWTRALCSTLGETLSFAPSDSFSTYPWPMKINGLDALGCQLHEVRIVASTGQSRCLTEMYNAYHNQREESDESILALRELHRKVDIAVVQAYGWNDLELDHDFHAVSYLPENDRIRFTISDPARLEVLRRLSELNRQRYEEEVAQGLHGNSGARPPRRVGRAANPQSVLDFETGTVMTPQGATPATVILDFLRTHNGWHAKADILAATGITDGQWNGAIADLLARGRVERQGERRGARYRAIR